MCVRPTTTDSLQLQFYEFWLCGKLVQVAWLDFKQVSFDFLFLDIGDEIFCSYFKKSSAVYFIVLWK